MLLTDHKIKLDIFQIVDMYTPYARQKTNDLIANEIVD